jgi:hypothetical protein
MKRRSNVAFLAALTLLAGFALPAMRAVAGEEVDIVKLIQNPKTAADHEAIAAYYDGEAAASQAKAELHEKMSETYKKAGGPLAKTHLHEHCDSLVRIYQGAAKDYRALAEIHRQMAKTAK